MPYENWHMSFCNNSSLTSRFNLSGHISLFLVCSKKFLSVYWFPSFNRWGQIATLISVDHLQEIAFSGNDLN